MLKRSASVNANAIRVLTTNDSRESLLIYIVILTPRVCSSPAPLFKASRQKPNTTVLDRRHAKTYPVCQSVMATG